MSEKDGSVREYDQRPSWLTLRAPEPGTLEKLQEMFKDLSLHTICENAACPNAGECFGRKTATFLILGDLCTRNCRFCNVTHGRPLPPDPAEPEHLAVAVKQLGLKYVVLTSVTRDDLPDGGAGHFAACINRLHAVCPGTDVEVLVPDFQGDERAVERVLEAGVTVFGHNIETVPELYQTVRPGADYQRSLAVLKAAKKTNPDVFTKSGLMLGLGEERGQVRQVLQDLRSVGCDILTLGQYLRPSLDHLPIVRYIPPDEFKVWEDEAYELGFAFVAAGSFVRSSYKAKEAAQAAKVRGDKL